MQTEHNIKYFVQPAELEEMLDELRIEIIQPVLAFILCTGFIPIFFATQFPHVLQGGVMGLLLFLLAFLGWFASRKGVSYSVWVLSAGCFFIIWLLVLWTQIEAFLCLLIVPIGLPIMLGRLTSGVIVNVFSSLCLFLLPMRFPFISGDMQWLVLMEIWLFTGLMWLSVKPLQGIIGWSWSNYKMNRNLVEEVRSQSLHTQEIIKDLADANLQLTRINDLALSLRISAEEARRVKEQFVANVSHELRAPLNMIIGFSEIILQAPKGIYGSRISPKLLADLDVILQNSRHLSKLIDDVLDLSQIDAGYLALNKMLSSMKEIIIAAVKSSQPLFQSKGLYLNVEVPDDLPAIECDITRIRQVVFNLLSNAGRFTETGGVTIRAEADEQWLTVSVMDTGPGLTLEMQEHLFQPFYQMDSSFREAYGGSGLGLSISKRLVEMHEGRIGFNSKENNGATFYFQLPVTMTQKGDRGFMRYINPYIQHEARTGLTTAPKPVRKSRFLVLERGSALNHLLARHIDQIEIHQVSTMQEAIQELKRVPAQALLINDLFAHDALYSLNDMNEIPIGIPVIACSIPGIEQAVGMMGVNDYLIKPIARETLLTTLSRLNIKGHTLLIADDEEDSLRLFRRMLHSTEQRYRILTAKNGREALDIMRAQRPDGVLMDLNMPVMDGFQLLAEKAKDPNIRDIPVIVISARDPSGQPIVSKTISLTQNGGLSLTQVLACISAFSAIVLKNNLNADLKTPEDHPDSQVS